MASYPQHSLFTKQIPMKKTFLFALTLSMALMAHADDITVSTPNTTLLLNAQTGQPLRVSYYGSRVTRPAEVYDAYSLWEEAYPAFGRGCLDITALSVKHFDGNMSTELEVTGHEQTVDGNSHLFTIHMKDKVYDLNVDVCYRAWQNADVIETWQTITNNEKKPITLLQYASGFMPMRRGNVWASHMHGTWAGEAELTEEPLNEGQLVVQALNGTRNAFNNRGEMMFSLDGRPEENRGRTIGAVIEWSGNYKFRVDTRSESVHRLVVGIDEEHSAYHLAKGQSFTTPAVAFAYSTEGKGGVSRAYHRWARLNGKVHNGQALRKMLLNSWEGVYMNVNQQGMEEMMDGIKDLGGELFVMDDGWFGTKYRRTEDDKALGDWKTDTLKLPQGVPALVKAAKDRGLKFGIWIEPEMCNNRSELYDAHPEWVVCHPKRQPQTGRGGTQLVLDLSNPKVQDFVFGIVDGLMQENPELYYIKWDCNMDINTFGSSYLTADNQSHLYVDYQLGLRKVLERIRAKYPDLVIQACASGGGRVSYGVMPYFDEFWVSDNTDAVQRLFLQWSSSHFYPANAMAQHVSASPNHQTGRVIPLKFRFDVASTGRLGMEMQPKHFSPQEREFAIKAIQTYKDVIRPIVQLGDLYRILSPYDHTGYSSQVYINEQKTEGVFFAYKYIHYINMPKPRFHFAGLNPNATYTLTELNRQAQGRAHWEGKQFTGKFLMDDGIELDLGGQYGSIVISLRQQ